MIGQIYKSPPLSPISQIAKVEETACKDNFPSLSVIIKNSATDFRIRAKEISQYYAALSAPAWHNIAAINNT